MPINFKLPAPHKPEMVCTSHDHAQYAEAVVHHYEKMSHDEDGQEGTITELLHDLMHWADRHHLDFQACVAVATIRYRGTLKEEQDLGEPHLFD